VTVVAHTVVGAPDAPRTLVCHPGGPGFPGHYFGDLGGVAGDDVRVVQVHPRGTDGTPRPTGGDYRLERYADDLDGLREHLELERLDLLGHSHGGFVAITYAAGRPDRTGDLVLVCTAPRFSPELRAEFSAVIARRAAEPRMAAAAAAMARRRAHDYATERELLDLLLLESALLYGPEVADVLGRHAFDPGALEAFNTHHAPGYDARPLLPRIGARTLVLCGAHDAFGPRIAAAELAAIPRAEVTTLDDAGHFPFLDAPRSFAARLRAFLAV
jgi:pimeloyl-ACP methyl ester carboxylesterase